jgi:hypothetical protein
MRIASVIGYGVPLSDTVNMWLLISAENCGSVFRSYSVAAANVRYYQIDAVIRLKDFCNFFNKVPLMKGASMKIYLNTNQCYFSISQSYGRYDTTPATFGDILAQPLLNLASNPTILGGGGTNPNIVCIQWPRSRCMSYNTICQHSSGNSGC